MKSIRDGSWFSGSHLSLEKILEITYLWCKDPTTTHYHEVVSSGRAYILLLIGATFADSKVCATFEADHFEQIGGPCRLCCGDR